MDDFHGKVAVVTGASRGIGRAVAEVLVRRGAAVVLSSRKQQALDEVAEHLRAQGGDVLAVAAHTGDGEAVARLFRRAAQVFGGVDFLVNNAATNPHFGPLLSAQESQWAKILDVNVVGYFRTVQAAVPLMRTRGGGKIVNVASVAGLMPLQGMGVYSVSKAGVLMLTKALAMELAGEHIQVNAIAPGLVKTRFSRPLWEDEALRERILQQIPQRRMATAEEVAEAVCFLLSPAADFMTGATLVLDGGQRWRAGFFT